MHIPVVSRDEYKGKSGNGDWADCLLQLDGDFGEFLDKTDALGLRESTIVVFAGDNGNEEMPSKEVADCVRLLLLAINSFCGSI
jgi:arylsulfatase A-like enzyme